MRYIKPIDLRISNLFGWQLGYRINSTRPLHMMALDPESLRA
jgi:hypothetical protein